MRIGNTYFTSGHWGLWAGGVTLNEGGMPINCTVTWGKTNGYGIYLRFFFHRFMLNWLAGQRWAHHRLIGAGTATQESE